MTVSKTLGFEVDLTQTRCVEPQSPRKSNYMIFEVDLI